MRTNKILSRTITKVVLLALVFAGVSNGLVATPSVSAQTCATTTTPATTYGQVTQSVSVTTGGTYRVWSRIKAPTTVNNSYYFQVDNGCAVNVGDSSGIPANTWTWVNYQNGNTGAFIDLTLTAGTHQLTYTGKEADVQLDRILLLSDTSCLPTGTGDNCATADATSPTTSISAPAAGTSVAAGSMVTINANATDNVGVAKVEFYVDGALKGTDTTSPYSYAWDTTGVAAGSHSLTVRAYDAAGNTSTSAAVSVGVTASANTVVINPVEDATIMLGTSTTNYGGNASLSVDNNPAEETLIKLPVTGTAGKTIQSAKLRLYNVNESDAGGTFHATGTSWSESTVNWSTAPAAGTQHGSIGAVAANTWYEVELKSLVVGDGTFAVRVKSQSPTGNGADYASSEATANKPQLIITLADAVAQPDLVVTNVTWSPATPAVGNAVTFSAVVKNQGAAATPSGVNTGIVFKVNGTNTNWTSHTSQIAAGQSVTLTATAGLSGTSTWTPTDGGTYTLLAHVDDTVKIAESNETNNTFTKSLTVGTTTTGTGDANNDGRVNAIDLSVVLTKDGQAYAPADFNGDGTVGAADMAILLGKWTW